MAEIRKHVIGRLRNVRAVYKQAFCCFLVLK